MPGVKAKYTCPTCGKGARVAEGCHTHKQSARELTKRWWDDKLAQDPDFKKKCNQEYYENNKEVLKQKMREYSRARYHRLKQQKQNAAIATDITN